MIKNIKIILISLLIITKIHSGNVNSTSSPSLATKLNKIFNTTTFSIPPPIPSSNTTVISSIAKNTTANILTSTLLAQNIQNKQKITVVNVSNTKQIQPVTYDYSTTNQLLIKLKQTYQSSLIPFMTASFVQNIGLDKIETIYTFLINKVPIIQSFTINIANIIPYGVRIILITKTDKSIYEALVGFNYKNGIISSTDYQLILWRSLKNLGDIDPDIFSKYFTLSISNSITQIQQLITRSFKTQQNISKFKKLISYEKKINFDGIYLKITLVSQNDLQYQIILYCIPQIDYVEVLKYQLLQNGYDISKQIAMTAYPQNNKNFDSTKNLLISNYLSILQKSKVAYMATYQNNISTYYRLIFTSFEGKYDIIISVNIKTLIANVTKWEKMDEGYVGQDISLLSGSQYFVNLTNFCKNNLKKLDINANPTFLQHKLISGYNKFFKFTFDKTVPFILIIDDKDNKGMSIRGFQRIHHS